MTAKAIQLPPAHGLDHWRKQLLAAPLALPAALTRRLRPNDRLSPAAQAQYWQAEPIALWHLLAAANQALARRQGHCHDASHALSLLGSAGVERVLAGIPAPEQPAPGLLAQLRADQFASALCAELAPQHPAQGQAALLLGAGRWRLWQLAPRPMAVLNGFYANPRFGSGPAERALFGCRLVELERAFLTSGTGFPELTQAAAWLDGRRVPSLVKLGRLADSQHHDPGLLPALCHGLAYSAQWDWYSRHSRRWLQRLARLTQRPLDEVIALTHRLAATFSRRYPEEADNLGAALLGQWQRATQLTPLRRAAPTPTAVTGAGTTAKPSADQPTTTANRGAAEPAASPSKPSAPPASPTPKPASASTSSFQPKSATASSPPPWHGRWQQFRDHPEAYRDPKTLLQTVAGLAAAMGAEQLALLLPTTDRRALRLAHQRGLAAPTQWRQPLDAQARRTLAPWLREDRFQVLTQRSAVDALPGNLARLAAPPFALASLTVAGRPLALWLLAAPADAVTWQRLRALHSAASQALAPMAAADTRRRVQ